MKKYLLIVLALALVACSGGDKAVVKVHVDDMTASEVVLLVDRTTMFTIPLDENGNGRIEIEGMGNMYPKLVYGRGMKQIFLAKGENARLSFNGARFADGVAVAGKWKEANEYLGTTTLPRFEELTLPWSEFKAALEEKIQDAVALMKARGLDRTCHAFFELESLRVRYAYSQMLIAYPLGHGLRTGRTDYVPEPEIYDMIRALCVECEPLADVADYRDFIRFAIPSLLEREGRAVSGAYARTVETMKYIVANFTSEKVKQTMVRSLAIEYFQAMGVENTGELQNLANAALKDPRLLAEYREALEQYNPLGTGQASPDFKAVDLAGKTYSLADFRGRYIYIDVWATWCGPCKGEHPHFRRLAEKYAGSDIVFLGLSVDRRKAEWERYMAKEPLAGTQLWMGTEDKFLQAYQIDGIPRFILIGREGQILDADMFRPSDPAAEKLLDSLE